MLLINANSIEFKKVSSPALHFIQLETHGGYNTQVFFFFLRSNWLYYWAASCLASRRALLGVVQNRRDFQEEGGSKGAFNKRMTFIFMHFLYFLLFSIAVDIRCYFVSLSGVQPTSQAPTHFAKGPRYFQSPSRSLHSCHTISDSVPYAVLHTPVQCTVPSPHFIFSLEGRTYPHSREQK